MQTTINAFFFDGTHLRDVADRNREAYQHAEPYPHIVLDDFLPQAVVTSLGQEFPSPSDQTWARRSDPTEVKLQSTAEEGMGPFTRQVLNQFNSSTFLDFLERLTGITGLVADPHYLGGGMHQIEPGGFLKVHADFNRHDRLGLDRRLNLLLYLNEDWKEDYGGHFEMWSPDMRHCVKRVLPVQNRCVVFSTTSETYHGHPEPLRCPPGRSRRSLALYYYTAGRPGAEQRSRHTTLFQARPDERFGDPRSLRSRLPSRATLRRFVPPIVSDWLAGR